MKLGAVIIDSRPIEYLNSINVFDRHMIFLPGFIDIHLQADIKSISDYNTLLTSIELWEALLNFDRVLIFQHDSGLLRTGIEEFYKWDYIGAPIKHIEFPAMNGGLSLRNPKAMVDCIKNAHYSSAIYGNEDMYFCHQLHKLGYKLPTKEVAAKFSVETMYNLGSLGFHAMNKYLTEDQCKNILNQYND